MRWCWCWCWSNLERDCEGQVAGMLDHSFFYEEVECRLMRDETWAIHHKILLRVYLQSETAKRRERHFAVEAIIPACPSFSLLLFRCGRWHTRHICQRRSTETSKSAGASNNRRM